MRAKMANAIVRMKRISVDGGVFYIVTVVRERCLRLLKIHER